MAYLFYLLRPSMAYVTNIAKCHMGGSPQSLAVYDTCASTHLRIEVTRVQPNLILAFSSLVTESRIAQWCGELLPWKTVLHFHHPAARVGHAERNQRVVSELHRLGDYLDSLGCNIGLIASTWTRDALKVLGKAD